MEILLFYLTISILQQNIIISKYAIIYHFSPTMAYGIGQYQKRGKKNRKRLENTKDPSLEPSTPSYSYKKLNEKTDIISKNN